MLDHLGLQVTDVDASLRFYLGVFGPIGMREAMRYPVDGSFVVGLAGPDGFPDFWLVPTRGGETREVHVAFRAGDRSAVDAVHEAAVAAGGGGPARAARVARVPPRLLRRVPARPGRPQRRGRPPRSASHGMRGEAASPGRPPSPSKASPQEPMATS